MTTTTTQRRTTASAERRAEWATARNVRLAALHEQVAAGVAVLAESVAWRAMLDTARRFHRYSLGNQLLIAAQCPEATQVAGFTTWMSLGRQVRKGERGITILAPCTTRTAVPDTANGTGPDTAAPDTAAPDTVNGSDQTDPPTDTTGDAAASAPSRTRWRTATVFDVTQTDGDPIVSVADLSTPTEGEAPAGLWDGLAAQVTAHGFTLQRGDCGSADGWTDPTTTVVRISGTRTDGAAVAVLAHELAHIVCGHVQDVSTYARCRGRCEVEAESVAYVVTGAHGLDTGGDSFGYVTVWAAGHPEQVRAAAEVVLRAARTILTTLEDTTDTTGTDHDTTGTEADPA